MSTIRITIRTGNAAFHDNGDDADGLGRGREVARILRNIAEQYERTGSANPPVDFNGNRIGNVKDTQKEGSGS